MTSVSLDVAHLRRWITENNPGRRTADEPRFAVTDGQIARRERWQRQLLKAGWLGWSWPEEYGGRGGTVADELIIQQELAQAGTPPIADPIGVFLVGPTVLALGREDQKKHWLPRILTGKEPWCQGFSEPDHGSDLASIETCAMLEGDTWRINGRKFWSSQPQYAHWCMLVARVDGEPGGVTVLLVNLKQPAVSVEPLRQITGEPEYGAIHFNDAMAPADSTHLLGQVGGGFKVALTTLKFERSSMLLAADFAVRTQELHYVLEQVATAGNPFSRELRQQMAHLEGEIAAFQALATESVLAASPDGAPHERSVLAKLQWSRAYQAVHEFAFELALQGDADATPWLYRFLRSRSASIEGGTTEILRDVVAERLLKLPKPLRGSRSE